MLDATPSKNAFEVSEHFASYSSSCLNESKCETEAQDTPDLKPQQCLKNLLPIFENYAKKHIWKKDEQEDFVQDAVLILLESLKNGKVQNYSFIRSYCLGICKKHLLVYIRNLTKRSKYAANIESTEFENFSDDVNETLKFENQEECQDLLRNISVSRDKEVLVDFYIKEKSRAEILSKFGFDDAHLYRVLYRAKRRAKEVLIARNISSSKCL